MTKKILYSIAIVAGLASCNGDYDDWATPQSNDASEAIDQFHLQVVQTLMDIDFAAEHGDSLLFFTTNLQEGVAVTDGFDLTLSNNGENPCQIQASAEGKVATADLENAVISIFGKKPVERTVYTDIHAKIAVTTPDGVVTVDKTFVTILLSAKPNAPFISTGYYLIGNMTNNWDASAMIPFNHSGNDVYEDPVFTVFFETTDVDQYWKIIPQSNVDAGNVWAEPEDGTGVVGVAVDGDTSESGLLITNGPKAAKIATPGKYKMTINMMEYTYSIEAVKWSPFIYEIGNNTGWTGVNPLAQNGEGTYQGYCWMDGGFKFKPNADNWDGDWEMVSDLGNNEYTFDTAGKSDFPGLNGFYEMNIDLVNMTAKMVEVKSITCVGNHNEWNQADATQHMTYNKDAGCWEITTTLKDGFKFAMNDAWTVSWGGANGDPTSYNDLTQNSGKDLNTPDGDGTYKVQLYLSYEGNNKVVITKQ